MNKRTFDYFTLIAQICVPIGIAIFGFLQFKSTLIFQETQNQISEKFQKTYKESEMQLKLFEIAWNSLNNNDLNSKMLSIKLLKSLNADFAKIIVTTIGQDNSQPEVIRNEANQYLIENYLSFIRNYRIDIYYIYYWDKQIANMIKKLIESKNLNNQVRVFYMHSDILYKVSTPSYNEIRYDGISEDIQANSLAALLNTSFINMNFILRSISNEKISPNYISIFIH
jgi:hypothetical protein